MENLPLLFEMLQADEVWVATLTMEEKQEIIDKANRVIMERYGST